ncbi:hypothetical protein HY970_02765 [Candidatus Kaiserbacteria bacterium]|nr:hypothetical protein [Candidatus Kaiserbacteria bacterium]
MTAQAVRKWQSANRITPTGAMGPKSRALFKEQCQ